MNTFQAAVLEEHNKPLIIRTLEHYNYLSVGQVLVRIHFSGICSAQLGEISAVKGTDKYLPHTLGHEGSGRVVAIGPGVKHVRLNDHVVIHWRKGIGIESELPKYWCEELHRDVGSGSNNTFQEYSIVSENRLTKISKDVPLDIAALMGCAVTTGIGTAVNELQIKPGQSAVIIGCGGVGLNVIQGCKLVSAYPIIGVDITHEKMYQAMLMGATHGFGPDDTDLIEFVKHIVGKRGADFVIDTTGISSLMETAWELAAPTGTVCLVAQLRHDQRMQLQTLPMHQGKRIIGSDGGGTNPTIDIPIYLKLYKAGRLNLDSLITHRFPLNRINDALDDVRAGRVGRAVIEMP